MVIFLFYQEIVSVEYSRQQEFTGHVDLGIESYSNIAMLENG